MPRPGQHLIDPDAAVTTALALIDADGLAAFSVERLARELGVRGPSLYHHFADRADLLAHVAQRILSEVPDPTLSGDRSAGLSWQDDLLQMTLALRHAALRHPNAAPVLIDHFPRHLLLPAYERKLAEMSAAGLAPSIQLMIIETLERLALGFAMHHPVFPSPSAEFPALAQALEAADQDGEATFASACSAFLAGIGLSLNAPA